MKNKDEFISKLNIFMIGFLIASLLITYMILTIDENRMYNLKVLREKIPAYPDSATSTLVNLDNIKVFECDDDNGIRCNYGRKEDTVVIRKYVATYGDTAQLYFSGTTDKNKLHLNITVPADLYNTLPDGVALRISYKELNLNGKTYISNIGILGRDGE